MSQHIAVLTGADGKVVCECDSTENQTADWELKISPIDASLFKSPSCMNSLKSNIELKVVKTHS